MDPQVAKELEDIKKRIAKIESLVPDFLPEDMRYLHGILDDLTIAAGNPVSNTPTANGYVPFTINGKRVNLITGS